MGKYSVESVKWGGALAAAGVGLKSNAVAAPTGVMGTWRGGMGAKRLKIAG